MVIFRISKGRTQYLRRVVQYRPPWYLGRALALNMDDEYATELVEKLKQLAKPA